MASCKLCASLLEVNRSQIRFTTKDEAQSHANQHFLQMNHFDDDNCTSLEQVFDQCFPNFGGTPARKQNKIVVKKEGRQSLSNVCQTVFKGRISEASPRVTCQKCGSGIIVYGGKRYGRQFGIAISHASAHLGIDLFECRKCGRCFGSKYAICNHLRVTHGLRYLAEHFADKSADFVDEITYSIEQCFDERNKNGPSDEKAPIIRLKNMAIVRTKTRGSKLAIERQLFCYQVTRQLAGDDGKIQCRLCPMRISIKQGRGYRVQSAMDHALVHLNKPVFRCKVCSNVHHSRASMTFHLKSMHALPMMNNYDSLVDELHADLLDVLRKCYAEKPGK